MQPYLIINKETYQLEGGGEVDGEPLAIVMADNASQAIKKFCLHFPMYNIMQVKVVTLSVVY